jgi:hypothetical protein
VIRIHCTKHSGKNPAAADYSICCAPAVEEVAENQGVCAAKRSIKSIQLVFGENWIKI